MTSPSAIVGFVSSLLLGLFVGLFLYYDQKGGFASSPNSTINKFPWYFWITSALFAVGLIVSQGFELSSDPVWEVRAAGVSLVFVSLLVYLAGTTFTADSRFLRNTALETPQWMIYMMFVFGLVCIICNILVYFGWDAKLSQCIAGCSAVGNLRSFFGGIISESVPIEAAKCPGQIPVTCQPTCSPPVVVAPCPALSTPVATTVTA